MEMQHLPKGWSIKKLGDLGTFSKGAGITKDELIEMGIPCIRYGEIYTIHDFVIRKYHSFISEETAKQSRKIKKNDILFAGSGETLLEIGKAVAYVEEDEVYAGGDIIVFSPNSVDSICLSYLLNSQVVVKQRSKFGQGNSVVHIYSKDLAKLIIPLPSSPEQQKIAQILSTWDETIQTTQELINQLEKRKKALMQRLLSGKGNEWKTYQITELIKQVRRPIKWDDNELYNLISVRRRSGGAFFRESLMGYQILTKDLYTAKKGDFLMSKMQISHGASGLVSEDLDNMKVSGSYIAVVAKNQDWLDMSFFDWYSRQKSFYHLCYTSSYGVHIEKMTFDFNTFLKRTITIPPIEEQTAITKILNTADTEIQETKAYLATLKEQKKGLMQQLLTGKTRVKIDE
jgi:type I restriction enzyme, S subunit